MQFGNILIVENYRPFAELLYDVFGHYIPSADVRTITPRTQCSDPSIVDRVRKLTASTSFDLALIDAELGPVVVNPLLATLAEEDTHIMLYETKTHKLPSDIVAPHDTIEIIPHKADLPQYFKEQFSQTQVK